MTRLITHFAIGAMITAIAIQVVFPEYRYKRTVIITGGIWALVPDIFRLTPVLMGTLSGLSDSPAAELFWFHRTVNRHVTGNEFREVGAVVVSMFFIVIVITEWYDTRRQNQR